MSSWLNGGRSPGICNLQRMLKELFGDSLPVFVAAGISRSAMSLIELASNTDEAATWITFVTPSSSCKS